MPENPSVDLAREDEFDSMHFEIEEAMHQIGRAIWLEETERGSLQRKLVRMSFRIARGLVPPDDVDGSLLTTVVREIGELLEPVVQRDPDHMEKRAERMDRRAEVLASAGKAAKAAEVRAEAATLRAEALEVRKRVALREARRGNG